MEPFTHVSDSVVNAAPVGGRRRKMKKVSAKTIRRTLKKMGLKPKGRVVLKGGEPTGEAEKEAAAPAMGGRRKRSASTRRRHRSASSGLKRMLGL